MKFCKLSRLRWAGHVIRQDDNGLTRRVLLSEPGGKRHRGRPRLCWEDGVQKDAAKLRCRNWPIVALNREGWRKLLEGGRGPPRAVVPLGMNGMVESVYSAVRTDSLHNADYVWSLKRFRRYLNMYLFYFVDEFQISTNYP